VTPRIAFAVALAVAGCGGETGTLDVALVAAPEGDLLARVDRVRVELGDPPTVVEAARQGGELVIELEVDAQDASGVITVDGFDAAGERIARGVSAALPLAAVNAAIRIYLGPPGGLAAAPVALDPPRAGVGAAPLPYGAILVGGRTAAGAASADVVIYNVYDHQLQLGLDLPAARESPTVLRGVTDLVYVFGGSDDDGAARAEGWAFNTSVAPAGLYIALAGEGDLARAGASGAAIAGDAFVVTGDPALRIDGPASSIGELDGAPPLTGGVAARLGQGDGARLVVVGDGVGEGGAVVLEGDGWTELDGPADLRRTGHAVIALPDGRGLVVGGTVDGAAVDTAAVLAPTGEVDDLGAGFLATARTGAAVAVAGGVVLVAGGVGKGGAVLADAERFDAATLEPLGAVTMAVPRRDAVALPLANGQILIAGGTGEDGEPVGPLELYTPEPP
jgi:hypothetical protein